MSESGAKTAIFISGSGTNMFEVGSECKEGSLKGLYDPRVVVSSTDSAGGIEKARSLGIHTQTINFGGHSTDVVGQINQILSRNQVEFCILAGWVKLIPATIVQRYHGKMINIHPAPLDPGREDFGGRGMYGLAPHIAVVAYAAITGDLHETESTVHLVTPEYDRGSLISTVTMPLPTLPERMTFQQVVSNPDLMISLAIELQKALLPIERRNLVDTLFRIHNEGLENIRTFSRSRKLIDSLHLTTLKEVKQFAIALAKSKH